MSTSIKYLSSRSRAGLAALGSTLWVALGACGIEAAGLGVEVVEAGLGRHECLPEPDYTREELEALAMSPEVQANIEPFGNAPLPDQRLHVAMSDGVRIAVSLYYPTDFIPAVTRAPSCTARPGTPRGRRTRMAIACTPSRLVVAIADPEDSAHRWIEAGF